MEIFWVLTCRRISTGLIFWLKDTASGIFVLSHVGAIVAGILAGAGWERSKKHKVSSPVEEET